MPTKKTNREKKERKLQKKLEKKYQKLEKKLRALELKLRKLGSRKAAPKAVAKAGKRGAAKRKKEPIEPMPAAPRSEPRPPNVITLPPDE